MGNIRINKDKLKKKKKKKTRSLAPVQSKLTKEQREFLDYKDIDTLSRFVSGVGKILPRKRTGASHREQATVRDVVKHARFMALLPFVNK
ncbi:MAG: 30S ribosomal protein S18 [Planctomycetes bacterium]|nr:30S ribosomal protein S18 [Planctomycetota bacterium]MCA8945466.1 30S ribosomal protein S18 [Planctomycetota bacterium]